MAKRYVTDIIGADYENWKPGNRILITNGTGSGKTFFVLNTLLRHAKAHGKHLVYFCNRKYLSLQVQSAAQKLLLNELGEDPDGLAAHLHIRTYQFAEHAFDYPSIHALDEDGRVIRNAYEVYSDDIMYYIFDEFFYVVADAGVNPNTHYWYDKVNITENQKSISVFLAATPEPLLLYLEFKRYGSGLKDLCMSFIAMHNINNPHLSSEQRVRCMRFYCPPLLRWEKERSHADNHLKIQPNGLMINPWVYANNQIDRLTELILEESRNPYWKFFEKVDRAYCSANPILTHAYQDERSLSERYAYLDAFYFDDMAILAKHIASSVKNNRKKETKEQDKRRWIVFVRKFEEATALRTSLRVMDCRSVAISSKITKNYDGSPCKRKGSVKKTLETLVHEERLDCDVLISTSVLDCGISLKNATDLVVCQPDKTSFLQMIGRIRETDGQRVNLYIQSFTPKEVKGHRDEAARMFLYMAQLFVMEETVHKSELGYQTNGEFDMERFFGSEQIPFLSKGIYQNLKEKVENDPKREHFLYYDDHGNKASRIRENIQPQLNAMAVLHYLNQVYFTRKELPEYTGDPYYFLKVQLSWLGKNYDPTRWIDYESTRDQLSNYLTKISEAFTAVNPMDKEDQAEFREKCFEYLCCLRQPPESFVITRKRHTVGSDQYPGKRKLNEIFVDLGIPYHINSVQNKSHKKDKDTKQIVLDPETGLPQIDDKSYWHLVSVDIEKERMALEEKRKSKQIVKEARIAEKAREEEQSPSVQKPVDPNNPLGVFIRNTPKKKKATQSTATALEPPQTEKPSLKVQLMRGDKSWDPSNQNER